MTTTNNGEGWKEEVPRHPTGTGDASRSAIAIFIRHNDVHTHMARHGNEHDHATRIDIPELECTRCGHKWYPRKTTWPKVCASCNSPYWNVPRDEKARALEKARTIPDLSDEDMTVLKGLLDLGFFEGPNIRPTIVEKIADKLEIDPERVWESIRKMAESTFREIIKKSFVDP